MEVCERLFVSLQYYHQYYSCYSSYEKRTKMYIIYPNDKIVTLLQLQFCHQSIMAITICTASLEQVTNKINNTQQILQLALFICHVRSHLLVYKLILGRKAYLSKYLTIISSYLCILYNNNFFLIILLIRHSSLMTATSIQDRQRFLWC